MLLFTTSVTYSVSYWDGENSDVQDFVAHSILKYSLLILISKKNNNNVGLWHIYWDMVNCRKLNFEFSLLEKSWSFTFQNDTLRIWNQCTMLPIVNAVLKVMMQYRIREFVDSSSSGSFPNSWISSKICKVNLRIFGKREQVFLWEASKGQIICDDTCSQ